MNVVDIFSCSGGMAEGLRRAGLTVTTAFDYDADACDSYDANHGHRPVQIDVRDLLRMAAQGWRPSSRFDEVVDLLVADPPCTPWSRAGKRLGQADERDMLGVTVDLIAQVMPSAFLIANVPGLDDEPNWPVIQRELGRLAAEGYCVRDFARLDAADYGVPQHRVRPFWFGHLFGPCLVWPERTHGSPEECAQPSLPGVAPLKPWVTCRDALGHLPPEDLGHPVRLRWRAQNGSQHGSVPDRPARVACTSSLGDGNVLTGPNHRPSRPSRPSRTITANTHSDGALLAHEKHPISRPDEPSYTVTARDQGGAQVARAIAWPWDRPATTTTTTDRLPAPGHHSWSMLLQPNAVKLSEKAAAILQGFPESWTFCGATKRARWAQIGMAMPPPLAEAVARCIARQHAAAGDEWTAVHGKKAKGAA